MKRPHENPNTYKEHRLIGSRVIICHQIRGRAPERNIWMEINGNSRSTQ